MHLWDVLGSVSPGTVRRMPRSPSTSAAELARAAHGPAAAADAGRASSFLTPANDFLQLPALLEAKNSPVLVFSVYSQTSKKTQPQDKQDIEDYLPSLSSYIQGAPSPCCRAGQTRC